MKKTTFHLLLSMLVAVFGFVFSANADEGNMADKKMDKKAEAVKKDKKAEKDGWNFKGQAVLYYQTVDGWGRGSLFDQGPGASDSGWAKAAAGLQLFAENKNLFNGIGAGFEVSGLSSLGLEEDVVFGMVQNAGSLNDAAITQAYLTYKHNNTSFKWGRQILPKSLSPLAYSETYNVFRNTYEAFTVINSDIKDTTLVYSYVTKQNKSNGDMTDFYDFYDAKGGVHMFAAQNKSYKDVTLTGSYYFVPDAIWANGGYASDADALWLDAQFKAAKLNFGLQGGYIGGLDLPGSDDTTAFGAKVNGKIDKYKWELAFSSTGDGTLNLANQFGADVKTPLYTQNGLNPNALKRDSDALVARLIQPLGKGKLIFAYTNADLGPTALKPGAPAAGIVGGEGTYQQFDVIYKGSIDKKTKYFVAWFHQNDDRQAEDTQNFVRVWVRHFF